jgi:hypothetical protein
VLPENKAFTAACGRGVNNIIEDDKDDSNDYVMAMISSF